jgi:2-C-methyl-D-erythritol 4-phosphate cytidylyltransferase
MRVGIIIVAGGSGRRMGSETPKQFLPLAGKPVLMRTIERLADALPEVDRIVVLPQEQTDRWAELCEQYDFTIPHTVATGGETRFHSVKNGLEIALAAGCEVIGVHDGVRPLVAKELIERVLDGAEECGAAIPVIPLSDSVREVDYCDSCQDLSHVVGSRPIDRNRLVAIQTPQFFRATILQKAYQQAYSSESANGQAYSTQFTDDASVVEAAGYTVTLTPGDPANIKITTPVDLVLAERLLIEL